MFHLFYSICIFALLLCPKLSANPQEEKVHVVVAMPYQPGKPYDPNWYSPEYADYIGSLLPADRYYTTGYMVSLQSIPQFLDDIKAMYDRHEKVCVINFCDGGEWDGYPGISVVQQWAEHPINGLVSMTGSDADFIFNSDDKAKVQGYFAKVNLKTLPQALVTAQQFEEVDLADLLVKSHLDQAWPLFCKLNIGAGALGIDASSVCHNITELAAQLKKLHDRFQTSDLLVQPYLPGPEYTILILKDRVYAGIQRDFHNHYNVMEEDYLHQGSVVENEVTYHPAPEEACNIALRAVLSIPGKHHFTRADLRNDGHGNIYVIDINDRPAFGQPSTVCDMLKFNHLSDKQFLIDLIETARL